MSGIEYHNTGVKIENGRPVCLNVNEAAENMPGSNREKTMAYKVLRLHCTKTADVNKNDNALNIKFDAMVSHDITYVSIIQTARVAGLSEFPLPYALTNCHNSLCAVGGTINEDDHTFGLSAAKKYGGIYVPANQAVIHQYARETLTGIGKMILGSDSHTRYGCFGTLGIGEGGGELVKQLLGRTYDITPPEVILIWLEGIPKRGIGPHDVALTLIKELFPEGRAKNKILEFAGPGIKSLPIDFRAGIDVMTTETSCLTSMWETDEIVRDYYKETGRDGNNSIDLKIEDGAYYDGFVKVNLSEIESMIALPFHPSRVFAIHELQSHPGRILKETQDACNNELGDNIMLDLLKSVNNKGEIICEQGIIVGCAGGMFDNISEAADIIKNKSVGNGYFDLSVYPSSVPVYLETIKHGLAESLMKAGAVIKPAFCGPCFGAGDTPAHNTLSIRHATRNFANREGSKPSGGQIASVALMDARSIAATAINKGVLTAATDINYEVIPRKYSYENSIYEKRCYNGYKKPDNTVKLRLGPNITSWPELASLKDNILIKICAVIKDDVTTTDELIPSGETSAFRSNPVALAEFTLSRRAPEYASMSKEIFTDTGMFEAVQVLTFAGGEQKDTSIGSCIFAKKPGDGSAREQAASCQRVLGGLGNVCYEYATKRYRSNCVNWGIIPFTIDKDEPFDYAPGDWIFIRDIKNALLSGKDRIQAMAIIGGILPDSKGIYTAKDILLKLDNLSDVEREIIAAGCLMNYYAKGAQ